MVPEHLAKYSHPIERFFLRFIPYQHLYFTLMLPLVRVSWTLQSLIHVFTASTSRYAKDRRHSQVELWTILAHWTWVFTQLWLLPNAPTRLTYLALSQLGGGFLIGAVVSFNHNSVDKYPGMMESIDI